MSINSMNSRFAMAEKMSIPQLQQSIQAGSLPAYVGVPLIEQRMQEQKKAAAMAQLAQAQQQAQQFGVPTEKPIAQGIMEQAAGIEAMPSNLPVAGYNDGGIVAFADGGEADDDFDYEEYQDEQEQAEYENLLNAYMAEAEAAGLEGIPINRTKKVEVGVEKKANGGIIGLNAGGILHYEGGGPVGDFLEPINFGDELDRAREESAAANATLRGISPSTSPEDFEKARQAALRARQSENLLQGQYELNMQNDPSVRPATMADVYRARPGSLPKNAPPLPAVEYAPPSSTSASSAPATLPPVVVNAGPERTLEDMDITRDSGIMGGDLPKVTKAGIDSVVNAGSRGTTGSGASGAGTASGTASTRERPKTAFEEFINNIKEERAALAKQKQDDKYMALLTAGLGMMSGTSPNAFANIGQGAQAGVAQYGASAKQRAAERAALNKSLLMGHRYQSMEDIAARTADINEARYREAAAARAAAAGAGSGDKEQRRLDTYEGALDKRITQISNSINAQLKSEFGDTGALLKEKEFNARRAQLERERLQPVLKVQSDFMSRRYPELFDQSSQQTPPANRPPLSSFNR